MNAIPTWQLYAIRYASVDRTVRGNFLRPEGLVDGPMRLDFFIWVAIAENDSRVIAIDTGFNRESSGRRNRVQECDPTTALNALGVDIATVDDVIITHLHYDHAGNFPAFPAAKFHLQEQEMDYATGRCMCDQHQSHFFEPDDIGAAVHALYGGRLRYHRGDAEVAPGISVHFIGGHTAGLQVVRVHTARGWVVLASDASHYFANKALRNPFPAIYDVDEMLRGYDRLDELADSSAHIVPGHDPDVLRIYPRRDNPRGLDIVCLHLTPTAEPRTRFA